MEYQEFINSKQVKTELYGFECDASGYGLFDFQQTIVEWATKKGRAAIFADTGLGKTAMQCVWADMVTKQTGGKVLILAPLCVSVQTVKEAQKFGITITPCRSMDDIQDGINITNYEMLKAFDCSVFEGVVLDESSILKSYMGKTKQMIIECFANTPYRLACTATPSPNDLLELGNHCEFLGVMPSSEMIMRWFLNDTMKAGGYRLKNHAAEDYWRWVSSWAICISNPSDMGYDGEKYILPALKSEFICVDVSDLPASDGQLFRTIELSATSMHAEGRITAARRAEAVANLCNNSKDQWLVWCNTNYESEELLKLIPDAVEVKGADTEKHKEYALNGFTDGIVRVLVTKPSIAGFGMNWQHCKNQAFVGLSYSYEDYYQAVRRCWRFGQKNEVNVFVIAADSQRQILKTIQEKESMHNEIKSEMVKAISAIHQSGDMKNQSPYFGFNEGESWKLHHGDCVHVAKLIDSDSVGFSVYSPPFSNLYIYSDSDYDMGNSVDDGEFMKHYSYLAEELYRITKPGRLTAIHCKDLPMYKGRDGAAGLRDFPGEIVKMYESKGWIYHSRVTIWKDPVIEMQRTKNHGLLYKQLCKDSSASRQGMADYMIVMRKWADEERWEAVTRGGERFHDYVGSTQHRPTAKDLQMARSDKERERLYSIAVWQRYASPVWFDIDQTDVLNYKLARENSDERHICPLQLGIIERSIELWSNPNDLVFSPFTGIGSEGVTAVNMGRKFVGAELKKAYFDIACQNLLETKVKQDDLFA
jgi:DNA modification methylase